MRHLCLLLALLPLGCIVEAPGGDSKQSPGAPLAAARPGSRPAGVRNGSIFDGKVELVAASFNPPMLTPGDVTEVKLYFRVLQPVTDDWQIFVHAEDPEGKLQRSNFDHVPVGGVRPTSSWRVGETIEDTFAIGLPAGSSQRGPRRRPASPGFASPGFASTVSAAGARAGVSGGTGAAALDSSTAATDGGQNVPGATGGY